MDEVGSVLGYGHLSQRVLSSLEQSEQAGTVQAVLIGRESLIRGWQRSIFKAFIPELGLGQVEGTEMAQGTRPRAVQPGTS